MLPVTISLGLINFNLLINSFFGSLVSDEAPAAIDKAFRIYQLPQGIFSVAIATVLFPTLARFANARRDRQPAGDDGQRDAPDPLRPAAGGGRDPRPLGPDDPARLPARRIRRRRRRRWSRRRSSGSPSRCRPTASTCCRRGPSSACSGPGRRPRLAVIDLVVSAVAALALYKPFGVGGIVAGTGIGTSAAVVAQALDPAARVRWAGARPPVLDRESGSRSPPPPWPRSAGSSGTSSTRRSAAAWPARSSRSASAWRSARLVYVAVARAAADRRARADHAPACGAAPRCSAPAATCWASPSSPSSSASPGLGAARVRARLLPRSEGAPAHLASAVLALALLLWAAEILGTRLALQAGARIWLVVAGGAGLGLLDLRPARRVAWGRGTSRPQARLRRAPCGCRHDIPPSRASLAMRRVALVIAALAVAHFAGGARSRGCRRA